MFSVDLSSFKSRISHKVRYIKMIFTFQHIRHTYTIFIYNTHTYVCVCACIYLSRFFNILLQTIYGCRCVYVCQKCSEYFLKKVAIVISPSLWNGIDISISAHKVQRGKWKILINIWRYLVCTLHSVEYAEISAFCTTWSFGMEHFIKLWILHVGWFLFCRLCTRLCIWY